MGVLKKLDLMMLIYLLLTSLRSQCVDQCLYDIEIV